MARRQLPIDKYPTKRAILEILVENLGNPLGWKDVLKLLKERGVHVHGSTVRIHLHSLTKRGYATRSFTKKGKQLWEGGPMLDHWQENKSEGGDER